MLKRPGTAIGLSEVNTLQQVHRCLLANCEQVALIRCTCLLLSAGCCFCFLHRVCAMPTPARYSLQGVSDRVNTRKHACIRALACCASRIGQLQLSAGCSEYCRACRAYRGLCNMATPGTGCKACLTASTHANRHALTSDTVFYCSHCAVAAVCNLFWLLPYAQGLCNMPTARYSLQHLFDRSNTSNRLTSMPDRCASSGCTVAPVCCHLLVLCCFWLHRVCNMLLNQHSQVRLHGMFDRVNTREKSCIFHFVWQLNRAVTAVCRLSNYCCMQGFVHVVEVRLQPARSFRPQNTSNQVH
jgi:hypothetical protein